MHVLLYLAKETANVITLRISQCRDYPGLIRRARCSQKSLWQKAVCRWPPETGRGKGHILLWVQEELSPANTSILALEGLFVDF